MIGSDAHQFSDATSTLQLRAGVESHPLADATELSTLTGQEDDAGYQLPYTTTILSTLTGQSSVLSNPFLDTTELSALPSNPRWIASNQYSDATELSTLNSQVGGVSDVSSGDRWNRPSVLKPSQFCVAILVVLLLGSVFDLRSCTRNHSSQHGVPDNEISYQNILHCAHRLSEKVSLDSQSSPQHAAVHWLSQFNLTTTGEQCPPALLQLYILIVVRESLIVPDQSWYVRPRDICSWSRIICDETFMITELSLENANLIGTLPSEIHGLSYLKRLAVFSNFEMQGTIPTSLGKVTSLVQILLHQTSLTGTLPSEFGQLNRLEQLMVHATQLTGSLPNEICRLPALKILHLPVQIVCSCGVTPHDTAWKQVDESSLSKKVAELVVKKKSKRCISFSS